MAIVNVTQLDVDSLVTAINNRAKSTDVAISLAAKQNTLVAGTGITIVGSTISANDTSVSWAEITAKPTTLAGYGITDAINVSAKGVANGVATLDAAGLVPATQLPSYVDDVLEYASVATLPAVGSVGKIYVTTDFNKIFRWTGTVYIEISATAGNADSATKLATARIISLSGDATGSVSFDGSANADIVVTVANDSHTHAFANLTAKPTTIAGYGITDAASSSHTHTLDALSNTTITTATSNDVLRFNGTAWVNSTLAAAGIAATGHTHTFASLSDTLVTTVAAGDVLKWSGTAWVNNTLAAAGIAPLAHVGSGGTAHAAASTTVAGFMSAADKSKLDGIAASANAYVLPVASTTVLGGVKAGTNITIDAAGVISANDASVAWGEITAKPTTLAGYGITDAQPLITASVDLSLLVI